MDSKVEGHSDLSSLLLSSKIANIFNKIEFSDVEFIVGKHRNRFYAHKLILLLKSSVFCNMLHKTSEATKTVEITNVDSQIFHKFLFYLYTDSVEFESVKEATQLQSIAATYNVVDLQEKCQKFIEKCVIPPNHVIKVYETATSPNTMMAQVVELCQDTFRRNTKAIFKNDSFLKAKISTVEAIVMNEVLSVDSEIEVLDAIVNWGRAQCEAQNLESSDLNIRNIIEPLIKYVRFCALSFNDLQNFIQKHNVLNNMELVFLVSTLLNKGSDSVLPAAFCPTSEKRMSLAQSLNDLSNIESVNDDENNFDEFHDCYDSLDEVSNYDNLNESSDTDSSEL